MQTFFLTVHSVGDSVGFSLFIIAVFGFAVWFIASNMARDKRIDRRIWNRTIRDAEATEKQARQIRQYKTFSSHIPGLPISTQIELPGMTEIEFEYFLVRGLWSYFGDRAEDYRFWQCDAGTRRLIKQIDKSQPYHTNELIHV